MLAIFCKSFPPASEREARMDEPHAPVEKKKIGKRNASLGLSFPSEGPFLFPPLKSSHFSRFGM